MSRNNQKEIVYKTISEKDSQKSQQNNNNSYIEDINVKNEKNKFKNQGNNYEYKKDNITFRSIDESTNRSVKAKITYSNEQNSNNNSYVEKNKHKFPRRIFIFKLFQCKFNI